jgi:hypothetical protein
MLLNDTLQSTISKSLKLREENEDLSFFDHLLEEDLDVIV